MDALLIEPTGKRHIPGLPRQLCHQAGGWQHRQGGDGLPLRIAAQAIKPATAIAQAKPALVEGQGRGQQQAQGAGFEVWAVFWCGNTGVVGAEGHARLPLPVAQMPACHPRQGQVIAQAGVFRQLP